MTIPASSQGDDGGACVRFRLGDRGFGVPLSEIREIAPADRVTPVPLAPAVVRGIAALRGQVVTLLDVAVIFGLAHPPARFREDRLMLVLDEPYAHLGLYVHAPVEIARAAVEHRAPVAPAAPLVMVAAAGAGRAAPPRDARAAAPRPGSPALSIEEAGAGSESASIVHLVSAGELVAYCDARVLEGFRRKA